MFDFQYFIFFFVFSLYVGTIFTLYDGINKLKRIKMKTQSNIFQNLEIASIIVGAIIVFISFIPGVLKMYFGKTFVFDVANFFLLGFFVGAAVMVGGFILFDYLDEKYN